MKNKYLKYAETCQSEADSLAYLLMKAKELMLLQSICDFNVWFVYDLSPVIMRDGTIEFLNKYRDRFKRKITLKEFMRYDCAIYWFDPKTFEEFKKIVT